jgi:hypothetical protein
MSLKSTTSRFTEPSSDYANLSEYSGTQNEPETDTPAAHEEPVYAAVQKKPLIYVTLLHSQNPPSNHQFVHSGASPSSAESDGTIYSTIDHNAGPDLPPKRYRLSEAADLLTDRQSRVAAKNSKVAAKELSKALGQLNATIRQLVRNFSASHPPGMKGLFGRSSYGAGAARDELLKRLFSTNFCVCASRVRKARDAVNPMVEPDGNRRPAEEFLGTMAAEFTRNAINALDDKQLEVLARHVGEPESLKSRAEEMSRKAKSLSAMTAGDMVIEQLINHVARTRRPII